VDDSGKHSLAGRTLTHYRISAVIGAGGMGEVYRATDTKLARDVALKILPPEMASDPDRLARFERETRLLASLAAPLPDLRFCPTGGIDLAKAPEYLKLPNVPCVGGSWMLQKAALASGDYLAVEALSRDAAELKRAAA